MLYETNELIKNPVKRLSELFGYKEYFDIIKKTIKKSLIKNEDNHLCKMCGRKQEEGFLDAKSTLIGTNNNDLYNFIRPHSPFICSHCTYLYELGTKKQQRKKLGKTIADTANILVFNNKVVEVELSKTSKNNELYKLVKNPPNEAYMLIFKKFKSISAFDMCFAQSMPTIDSELIILNYGFERHCVPRYKIIEGSHHALEIFELAKKEKVNLSKDTLFNTKRSEEFHNWLSINIRSNKNVFNAYLEYIKKYNNSCRLAISIVWESFLQDHY